MKKFLMCVAAMACLVVTVSAQTAEEKQASAERLEKLRMEQPKACGVQQIDDLAAKCKTMADEMCIRDSPCSCGRPWRCR